MQRCPQCGEENPPRFRLCGFCGARLAPELPPQEVRKTVTVLFCDLKGSTSLGESLDSESLRGVMNRYFQEMSAVVERHGGTVEKFIGDAVMAVFGLPRLHEDDALRAVRAAAEMQERLRELNSELERFWGVTLANRTGVNTGEVVAGDVTTGQRLVTGDAVNVAARLEQAAPAMEVLLGELTYRLVRNAVEVEAVEPLPLKGKAEPVPAYRLLGVKPGDGIARRLDSPMVGRAEELSLLRGAFSAARDGPSCRMAAVLADAGMGKSRLCHELTRLLAPEATILRGRCLSYGEGITFWPLAEVVRQAASMSDEDDATTALARLSELLGPDEEMAVERIAGAIGLTSVVFPLEETFWAARRLLETLAHRRPLVVIWDDLHWAEETFLDLIEYVATSSSGPILLVCGSRPDLLERRAGWAEAPAALRLRLQPLTEAESTLVVQNLLGEAGIPRPVCDAVVRASEGNPLFVEQMLSMLVDDGLLRRVDGGWRPAAGLEDVRVPPTIQALISARLDALDPEERAVVEPAAVIGHQFPAAAVRELVPEMVRERVGPHLASLARKQLVRPDEDLHGDDYRFNHIMIRDAAYGALLKRSRADLHERFADWLDRHLRARSLEYEEILGYHLEQAYLYRSELGPIDDAGRVLGVRAAERLADAGRRAFARGDSSAAVNLLRRAAAVLGEGSRLRLELLPDLGEALMDVGELDEADLLLEDAVAAASDLRDVRLEIDALMAKLLVRYSTDVDMPLEELRGLVDRAIGTLEAVGDQRGLARAWRVLACAYGTTCRYGASEDAAQRAIDHARLAGDVRQESRTIAAYVMSALYGPTPVAEALARCEQIRAQAHGDRRSEGLVLGALAHLHAMEGRFDLAREHYRREQLVLDELGGRMLAASTSLDSSRVELLAGQPHAAEAELRRDYYVLDEMGERYFLSTMAALLAQALLAQDRDDEAFALSVTSQELAADDDVEAQALWRSVRARLMARRGEAERAVDLAEEAMEIAERTDAPVMRGDALLDLARVLVDAGDASAAAERATAALDLYEAKGTLVAAREARALLDSLMGSAALSR
jgi:class 3 adenylate cyclase